MASRSRIEIVLPTEFGQAWRPTQLIASNNPLRRCLAEVVSGLCATTANSTEAREPPGRARWRVALPAQPSMSSGEADVGRLVSMARCASGDSLRPLTVFSQYGHVNE